MGNHAGLMCRVLLLCATSFLWVCSFTGQEKSGDKAVLQTENEVLKVEQSRDKALQERDVALLDKIYSDQLVFINTRGQTFTKMQRLADLGGRESRILLLQPGMLLLPRVRRHGRDDGAHQFRREVPWEGQ
jgi:hypothetical protein